jgi:CubicO group peptidase (beta-lactamase class C family)
MDETIARYGNLVFPPGRLYEYSNPGFGIIAHIISRVSGQPSADERYDARQRPIPFYT